MPMPHCYLLEVPQSFEHPEPPEVLEVFPKEYNVHSNLAIDDPARHLGPVVGPKSHNWNLEEHRLVPEPCMVDSPVPKVQIEVPDVQLVEQAEVPHVQLDEQPEVSEVAKAFVVLQQQPGAFRMLF